MVMIIGPRNLGPSAVTLTAQKNMARMPNQWVSEGDIERRLLKQNPEDL